MKSFMTWFVQDAFLAWEESSDPEEQEGKGVALKSCTQFIQWLKEAEVEEDEEEKQNKEKVNINLLFSQCHARLQT